MEEINNILTERLKDLIKVWDKPKVNDKEASKIWNLARIEILTAGLVMKSYDSRKFDEDGTRIDNILRIQQAIKRTWTFQKKLRNDMKMKGNEKAEYRIRQIVKRNKRKFQNINQIL
uniref:Four helix bundle protein n=1 Tax=Strongyloides venezuelensis TaxID=75913 RepID=A0A0K0FTC5_STRVS